MSAGGSTDVLSHRGMRMALSLKFALAFIGLVSFVLIVNGGVNMWLSYAEAKSAAVTVQREKLKPPPVA